MIKGLQKLKRFKGTDLKRTAISWGAGLILNTYHKTEGWSSTALLNENNEHTLQPAQFPQLTTYGNV